MNRAKPAAAKPAASTAPVAGPAPVVIAIDGPSASGKSTLARRLAAELGFAHVDTGAMYRAFAWWCSARGLDVGSERVVAPELARWRARLENLDGEVRLLVDGYFPEAEIRTDRTTDAASRIAVHPKVRSWMVARQRECVRFGSLVVEGRDIGTKVFPDTPLKFFIDASAETRQARRAAQNLSDGRADLAERDKRDSQRRGDPLMPALGAVRIDNTGETPDATAERLLKLIRERMSLNRTSISHIKPPSE